MNLEQFYINRCIELAKNGLGTTYPNPMVGSVIVHDNKIIGEGWHQKAGLAHAEVNAVNSVKNKELLSKSTIYVSLEPCSHFGKTPPCADLIIKHKIPRVVIGTTDPFAKVCGNGIKKLQEAGIQVQVGFLQEECNALNKRFFTFHQKKRPYVILKWAQSRDGFIAPIFKDELAPVWISNKYSRQIVHKWRSEEQAILVGANTVLQDNPKLNVRDWYGNNPIRIVIDKNLSLSRNFHVSDQSVKTIFITESEDISQKNNLIFEKINFNQNITKQIMEVLYKHGIQSVIIEGGKKTLEMFISENAWDEARVFSSDILLKSGVLAPKFNFYSSNQTSIKGDKLEYFYNQK